MVGDQTLGTAARERSGAAVGEELRSASLPPWRLLESLLARRCWERQRRLLVAGEVEAAILPEPEVVEERKREAGAVVLAVMMARQTMAAVVPGRSAEQGLMIYWRMVFER